VQSIHDIAQIVDTHGWTVQIMSEDHTTPAFAYTVGLSGQKFPELVLFGSLSPEVMAGVLNSVADLFFRSGEAICGDMYQALRNVPVRLREIDVREFSKYGILADCWADRYIHSINRAIQVVLPDAQGRFPEHDPNYDWVTVPLLTEVE
jgi:hypothetical protein